MNGQGMGHIWATTAREYGVKQAVSSQPRALRINTGYNFDMTGSHEVGSSNLPRSTNQTLYIQSDPIFQCHRNYRLCSKNVPKYVQFGLAVPDITSCSLAFRSILASASRIMVSFAWLYRLKTWASPCRSIWDTK